MSFKYIAKKSDGLPAFPMESVGGMLMTWKYDDCGGSCGNFCGDTPRILSYSCPSCDGIHEVKSCGECVEVIETVKAKCTNTGVLRGYCGICNKKVFNTQARICVNGVYSHDDNRYCKYLKWGN
jgi:hypothetical protein